MAHIRVDFISRSTFHGLDRESAQEWPPSPMRVLGALIAGAHAIGGESARNRAIAATRQVAQLPPPIVHLPASVRLDHPDTFTEKSAPTAARMTTGPLSKFVDMTHLGMDTSSRTAKPMRGRLLAEPTIIFELGDGLNRDQLADLQTAASQVGYFGRSQDHAVIVISDVEPDLTNLTAFVPDPHPAGQQRGWTQSSCDWFEARHRAIMIDPGAPLPSDAGAFRPLRYRPTGTDLIDGRTAEADETSMTAVMFTRGIRPADASRELAKLDATDPSISLIPLVNYNHAPLKCYGVALAGPLETRLTMAAYMSDALGPLATDDAGAQSRLFFKYTSMPPATRWITATPIRAFGHPLMLERTLESEFGTRVEIEAADTRPIEAWQQRLPESNLGDGLSQWFVQFRTNEPLPAPRMVGAGRYWGFGLCVQIPEGADR